MFANLSNDNFPLFASKYYVNPHCIDVLEFKEDLKRIRYIKRLFRKYRQTGELKEQLIINHLIILYNVFETKPMTRMLVLKLGEYLDCLKPFLMELNYWEDPNRLGDINRKRIHDADIDADQRIIDRLQKVINNG